MKKMTSCANCKWNEIWTSYSPNEHYMSSCKHPDGLESNRVSIPTYSDNYSCEKCSKFENIKNCRVDIALGNSIIQTKEKTYAPSKGEIFDFTKAESDVLVCGKEYHTQRHGYSRPKNVKGMKIKILKVNLANPHDFGMIKFAILS